MSPALAHECPDTPRSPAVQATCQGGAVHAPGAPPGGAPSHAQVEAPCSALAVDTAEERLCPCTSGSTMLRAGDKQLRAAPRSYQPQGAQSSASSLTATPPLGRATRGGCARVAPARVAPKRTLPNQVSQTWASRAPPEASARAGTEIVCTSRGTPEHRDSGA